MKTCGICKRADRREIEAAMLSRSYRAITRQFSGVSKDSLARHKAHIGPALRAAGQEAALASGVAIRGGLERLLTRVDSIMTSAEAVKDSDTALKASGESRRILSNGLKVLVAVDLEDRVAKLEAGKELAHEEQDHEE